MLAVRGSLPGNPEYSEYSLTGRLPSCDLIEGPGASSPPKTLVSSVARWDGGAARGTFSLAELDGASGPTEADGSAFSATSMGLKAPWVSGSVIAGTSLLSALTLLDAPSAPIGSMPRSANVFTRSASTSCRRRMKAGGKHPPNTPPP